MHSIDKKKKPNFLHMKLKGTQGTRGKEEVIVFSPD